MLASVTTNPQISSVLTADIWTLSTIYFTVTLWGNCRHYNRIKDNNTKNNNNATCRAVIPHKQHLISSWYWKTNGRKVKEIEVCILV